jgi:ADP-heptose:LPS heptosyltransferase
MKVLIFHTGSLGDTLVAIPAFRAIREHFKSAHITLLSDTQTDGTLVPSSSVLDGKNLVDEYINYSPPGRHSGTLAKYLNLINLLGILRGGRYNTLVYLIRDRPNMISILRDLAFFKLAGVRRFVGIRAVPKRKFKNAKHPAREVVHQTDLLLDRLELSGIPVPSKDKRSLNIMIMDEERKAVDEWISKLLPADNRDLIAIGPGSKMPSKRWPIDRFAEVVNRLIEVYDVWPVVFGGPEDKASGEDLIAKWKRGWVAAGDLNISQSFAMMERCAFYLGNDTGTMHMAVAAGIPCVAIFSSQDLPGLWYPYGHGHIVFRTNIGCEGCMLQECIENKIKCILSIDVDSVYKATEQMLLNVGTSSGTTAMGE